VNVQQISSGAVLARIWAVYRDHFSVLFAIAVPLYAVLVVASFSLSTSAALPLVALFWALSVLYQGIVVKLVQDVQDERRDHSIRDLVRSVEPVFWRLLGVSLLYGICVGIGFILLIVPGLILMVIWAVVAPVMVLERPGVLAAFGRSRELVRGNGWNVFAVIIVVSIGVGVVGFVAGIATSSLGSVGRALVQWVVDASLAPLQALSAPVLYFALLGRPYQRDDSS
jgi:hypothetical protein